MDSKTEKNKPKSQKATTKTTNINLVGLIFLAFGITIKLITDESPSFSNIFIAIMLIGVFLTLAYPRLKTTHPTRKIIEKIGTGLFLLAMGIYYLAGDILMFSFVRLSPILATIGILFLVKALMLPVQKK
jgi:protein-S-isoprenylcysteine O-methyltransferase Ste14